MSIRLVQTILMFLLNKADSYSVFQYGLASVLPYHSLHL